MLFVCQRLWLFPLFDWECPSRNGRLICYLRDQLQMSFSFLQWIKERWKTLRGHCNEAEVFLSVWCLFLLVVPWFRGWSATWVLPGRLRLDVINLDIGLSLECLLLVLFVKCCTCMIYFVPRAINRVSVESSVLKCYSCTARKQLVIEKKKSI